jgi:hypothetical protein
MRVSLKKYCMLLIVIVCGSGATNAARAADCESPPLYFNGNLADISGTTTVKAGKGCAFGINGIQGAINETLITQKPKVGQADVRGNRAIYVAKPGYLGADEFAYTYVGTDQYGGPMRVTIRRIITVVP